MDLVSETITSLWSLTARMKTIFNPQGLSEFVYSEIWNQYNLYSEFLITESLLAKSRGLSLCVACKVTNPSRYTVLKMLIHISCLCRLAAIAFHAKLKSTVFFQGLKAVLWNGQNGYSLSQLCIEWVSSSVVVSFILC